MSDHFSDVGKKVREDFEEWAQSSPVNLEKNAEGGYVSSVAAFGCRAYQAATQHSAAKAAELECEVQALRLDKERIERNRDMWRSQCSRQAEDLRALRSQSHFPPECRP